jgi:HEAT repeats
VADLLNDILHDKHRVSREFLAALRPEDVEQIRKTAVERGNPDRVRATNVLVTANDKAVEAILLHNFKDEADASVRGAAASQLGRIQASGSVEEVLRGALLVEPDPGVQIQIAGALGRIGGPDALEPLGKLMGLSDGLVKEQAVFARAVVAHRNRVVGYELPAPDARDALPLNSELAKPFAFVQAPLREALLAAENIGREAWGLTLQPERCYLVRCGADQMAVFVDFDALASRPGVVGLVADRSPEDGSYGVHWLVLSWAGDGKSHRCLAVHRPSGARIFGGTVGLGPKGGKFELRSVNRAGGVPILIRGRTDGQALHVVDAISEQRATPRRTPAPMQPPKREPR